MALNLDNGITADSIDTLTNKAVNSDNNNITNLEVTSLKNGVLDVALTAPVDHSTLPSAKGVKARLDEKVTISLNLADVNAALARANLDVLSEAEVLQAIQDNSDEDNSYGNITINRDSQDVVTSIITNMLSGNVRTETINRGVNGDVTSIDTDIPGLGINRTETLVRDSNGNVTGVTV